MTCAALLWAIMPPQSITYAIGVGLHSQGNYADLVKLLRTSWSFLDAGCAVECLIGDVGAMRLRLQMEMLVGQLERCKKSSGLSEEEDKQPLENARKTFQRLYSMCEGDSRFAQVAVIYGVAFMAESMCAWAEKASGGEATAQEAQRLVQMLNPHVEQLFQKNAEWTAFCLSDLLGSNEFGVGTSICSMKENA